MKTRGQKRAGRNRGSGVREPNGRLQRASNKGGKLKETARSARERVYGVPKNFSDNPQSGYALGILYYNREIQRSHHDAGLMIAELVHDYYRIVLNSRPPIAQAIDLARVSGRGMDNDEPHPAHEAVKERFAGMQAAIRQVDCPGRPVWQMVSRICMEDDRSAMMTDFMLEQLRFGLNRVYYEFQQEISFKYSGQKLIQCYTQEKHPEDA